jgi:hypothetical protein
MEEWDDYDLKTLDFLPWLQSFGSYCTGMLFNISITQHIELTLHRHQPQLRPQQASRDST